MVNSESHSSNDQVPPSTTSSPHEDGYEEAVKKLLECTLTLPKTNEFNTKMVSEGFKAANLHDEEGKFAEYMKGGACKESFVAHAESPDGHKPDKLMAMLDCMQANSDYYHKYNEIIEEQASVVAMKELESTFPGGDGQMLLGFHEFFTKGEGGCCKEQYLACVDSLIEEEASKDEDQEEFGPEFITFTKQLFRFL